jgi:predicted nucleotidyltransferase
MNDLMELKDKLLRENKGVKLILVNGSYAIKKLGKYSDVDVEVITLNKPRHELEFYTMNIEGRKRLVTVFYTRFKDLLKSLENSEEWNVMQNYKRAKIFFDSNNNFVLLKKKIKKTKPKRSDYFHRFDVRFMVLFEYLSKAKNAYESKDDVNLIYAAKQIAFFSSLCLNPYNDVKEYKSERDFYLSLFKLKNKPKNYDVLLKVCYGLDFNNFSRKKLYDSAHLLVEEMYYFFKEKKVWLKVPSVKKIFEDDYFSNLFKIK